MGHATVYEHEPRNVGLKSEPSRLDTKPGFTDWLLQNVRKILDTTENLRRGQIWPRKRARGMGLGMGIWDGPGNISKEKSHLHGIFNLGSTIAIS